jgi:hypothetical protein
VLVVSLENSHIEAQCVVAYINDDGNELLLGLKFTTISDAAQDLLSKYVASLRDRNALTV